MKRAILSGGLALVLVLFSLVVAGNLGDNEKAAGSSPQVDPILIGQSDRSPEYIDETAQFVSTGSGSLRWSQGQWDALYYKINLDVHFLVIDGIIDGIVDIHASSRIHGLSFVELDFENEPNLLNLDTLEIDSIRVDSVLNTNWVDSLKFIYVEFDNPISADSTFTITVFYEGRPRQYVQVPGFTTWVGFKFDNHGIGPDNEKIAATLSSPFYARTWWPCKDAPIDKADSIDIIITHPDDFVCAANGVKVNSAFSNGTKTCTWHHGHPIATYLVGLGVTNYDTTRNTIWVSQDNDTVPIPLYIFPEKLPDVDNAHWLELLPSMLTFYSDLFGKYLYYDEKCGMLQCTNMFGAMEHPTITSISYLKYHEGALAHELAHSWWGNPITCRDWRHIWLNEGFAVYSAALWFENEGGESLFDWYMDSIRYLGPGTIIVEDEDTTSDTAIFNYDLTYYKAGWVPHMLRHWVGDEMLFDSILPEYWTRYKDSTVITQDFVDVCIDVSGDSRLQDFFDEWIYGAWHPEYEQGCIIQPDSMVYFSVKQIQTPVDSPWVPEVYHMPIDIVLDDGNRKETVTVFNDEREQIFILEPPDTMLPTSAYMSLDWLLAETTFVLCVFDERPLANGVIDVYYEDTVVFGCSAALEIVDDGLPPGLTWECPAAGLLVIEGTPTEFGRFYFTVRAKFSETPPFFYHVYSIFIGFDGTEGCCYVERSLDDMYLVWDYGTAQSDTIESVDGVYDGEGERPFGIDPPVNKLWFMTQIERHVSELPIDKDVEVTFLGRIIAYDSTGSDTTQTIDLPLIAPGQHYSGLAFQKHQYAKSFPNPAFWYSIFGVDSLFQVKVYGDPVAQYPAYSNSITGLAFDNDNQHLWAIIRGSPDSLIEYNAANGEVIQGPMVVPWPVDSPFSAAGLEYDEADDLLIAVNRHTWHAVGLADVDPDFSGPRGIGEPGVVFQDLRDSCGVYFTPSPTGVALMIPPEGCSFMFVAGNSGGSPYPLDEYRFDFCCNHDGIRGDADDDGSITIGDAVYLVQYIFFGGPPPPCFEEGDVDGDGSINVADLVYLVDYVFFGGPEPAPCP